MPLRCSGRLACRAPLALLLLGACQRDSTFHTVGHYEAPGGRYEIAIEANGKVRAGSDLSDEATATVRITPAPGAAGDSLHLQIVLPDRLAIENDFTAIGRMRAGNDFDQRRFACTVFSHQRMDFAAAQLE